MTPEAHKEGLLMLSVVTMYFPQCSMPDLSRLSKPLNSGEVSRTVGNDYYIAALDRLESLPPWAATLRLMATIGTRARVQEVSSLRLRYAARDGVNKTARWMLGEMGVASRRGCFSKHRFAESATSVSLVQHFYIAPASLKRHPKPGEGILTLTPR
jgi:hypothetical protein